MLQKSKIEQPQKLRESQSLDFSDAASVFKAAMEARDRFWVKPMVPHVAARRTHHRLQKSFWGDERKFLEPEVTLRSVEMFTGYEKLFL